MTRMDLWRNEKVKRRFDVGKTMSVRNAWKVLEWFGRVEHMLVERLTNRI